MSDIDDLKERLAATKRRLRKTEDTALAECRREAELDAAYARTNAVRPDLLPRQFNRQRGRG